MPHDQISQTPSDRIKWRRSPRSPDLRPDRRQEPDWCGVTINGSRTQWGVGSEPARMSAAVQQSGFGHATTFEEFADLAP